MMRSVLKHFPNFTRSLPRKMGSFVITGSKRREGFATLLAGFTLSGGYLAYTSSSPKLSFSREVIRARVWIQMTSAALMKYVSSGIKPLWGKCGQHEDSTEIIHIMNDLFNNHSSFYIAETDTPVMKINDFLNYCRSGEGNSKKEPLDATTCVDSIPPLWKGSKFFLRDAGAKNVGVLSLQDFFLVYHILTNRPEFFKPIFNALRKDKPYINRDHFNYMKTSLMGNQSTLDDDSGFSAITVHLTRKDGYGVIRYMDFRRFAENIQAEVLEIEHDHFTSGSGKFGTKECARWITRFETASDKKRLIGTSQIFIEDDNPHVNMDPADLLSVHKFLLSHIEDLVVALYIRREYGAGKKGLSENDLTLAVKAVSPYTLHPVFIKSVHALFYDQGTKSFDIEEMRETFINRRNFGLDLRVKREPPEVNGTLHF